MPDPAKKTSSTIELDDVRDLLLHVVGRVQSLNKTEIPDENTRGRDRSAALAPIHRELLYLAHLCRKAGVAIDDEYHRTRGYTEFTDGTIE